MGNFENGHTFGAEADGAVHWKSMCPKVRRAFQEDGAQTS